MAGFMVLSTAMVAIYPVLLSRALKPKFSVALYVETGVCRDAPLALRKDMRRIMGRVERRPIRNPATASTWICRNIR